MISRRSPSDQLSYMFLACDLSALRLGFEGLTQFSIWAMADFQLGLRDLDDLSMGQFL